MGNTDPTSDRWTLFDMPLAARLTIAAFMISVGLGYLSALVNLHFQEATPGKPLPDGDDVTRVYHGKSGMSQFERLIVAHPSLPFNGDGSMRRAFTTRAKPAAKKLKEIGKRMGLPPTDQKVRDQYFKEVDGERIALIAWVRDGAPKEAYEKDAFKLTGKMKEVVINPEFVENDEVKIKSIIDTRCASCHGANVGGPASRYPLEDYEDITTYTSPESRGKSLPKLALTTHVHLLGFSMLYGLTGLVLALTPLPGWLRLPLAPAALVAQVVDISFWWLARMDEPYGPMFAKGIMVTGGIVALSLGLQIILTVFSLFGRGGKLLVVVLLAAAIGGGLGLKQKVLDPYLAKEKESMKALEE